MSATFMLGAVHRPAKGLPAGAKFVEEAVELLLGRRKGMGCLEPRHIGHDPARAFREATFLGLPDDDARIPRFISATGDAYAGA